MPEEKMFTVTEAREKMGVSKNRIAEMIRVGELHTYPDVRHKQIKLIPASEVYAWLAKAGPPRPKKRPGREEIAGGSAAMPAFA